jgi:hypothetical protein
MVIVNYWLLFTSDFTTGVTGVLPIIPDQDPREDDTITVQSVQFPLLNVLRPDTAEMMRHFPRRYGGDFAPGLWNCMARAPGLFALVGMREELQLLRSTYPDNIDIGGCWNFSTGEPVGGVGSPWFPSPPELIDFLPPQPQPQPEQPFPPSIINPPLNVLWDVILGAGQAPRQFV